MSESMRAPKGLAGLIVDDSAVSKVDVGINKLIYRGYDIGELCDKASFLETAYLLLHGELPTAGELAAFEGRERRLRELPPGVYKLFENVPATAHPMDYLKLGVQFIACRDPDNKLGENSREQNLSRATSLLVKLPVLRANAYHVVHGGTPHPPDPSLPYTQNFLSMMRSERVDDPLENKVLDAALILYAEHGFNASTFSARVTASTLSDYYSAVVSAIGTLKGPLHGGANEQVMVLLREIGRPEAAEKILLDKLARKEKIMGFGHRLYRTGDSRTGIIKKLGRELAEKKGVTVWHDISDVLEAIMIREKGIYPNLDFPAATAFYLLGIPIELYTPIFVASRITGWSAHLLEQYADNRLIRPGSEYTGPGPRRVPPLNER